LEVFHRSPLCTGNKDVTGSVGRARRLVLHVPIQVTIPRIKPQRILTDPPPGCRVVVPRPVVLQPRLDIELAAGELVPAAVVMIRLVRDTAEPIVRDLVPDPARV